MRLLLDTHIAVWAVVNDDRLTQKARSLIETEDDICVSIASVWEIAIKYSIGPRTAGTLPISGAEAHTCFVDAGFVLVPIEQKHIAKLEQLPWFHRDPFDRLLVATAMTSKRWLLTQDAALFAYSDSVLSA
ncbi:MAG: type II toxin-antitoxin system VapC family toxin [Hyphomicrobium aestuarii]|nr:type II toxin-antitoxin system VapC family toxin [Hyphomicrobium aestuarii]